MGTRELWRRLARKRTGILNEELNLTCMRSNPNDHEYKTHIFLAMLTSGSLVLRIFHTTQALVFKQRTGPTAWDSRRRKEARKGSYKLPSVAQTEQAMPRLHGGAPLFTHRDPNACIASEPGLACAASDSSWLVLKTCAGPSSELPALPPEKDIF